MAITGLLLFLFLLSHAAGNATFYLGSSHFQKYADQLHSHPIIVALFSGTLFVIFLLHVITGMILFFQNSKNRYFRYHVSKRVVKNSLASKTMGYSGILILFFILCHVWGFTLNKGEVAISELVSTTLNQPVIALFYLTSFFVLAIHLSHGFFSMIQTFGLNHPRYSQLIDRFSLYIPLLFLVLFGGIPLILLLN